MQTAVSDRRREATALRSHRLGPEISAAAPIVPVRNVRNSVTFYTCVLGFELKQQNSDWSAALVARGGARLLLIRQTDYGALRATERHFSAYLWVDHVDALYAELKPALDSLPAGRVDPPFDRGPGRREFHVRDPDGFLLFFGTELAPH